MHVRCPDTRKIMRVHTEMVRERQQIARKHTAVLTTLWRAETKWVTDLVNKIESGQYDPPAADEEVAIVPAPDKAADE